MDSVGAMVAGRHARGADNAEAIAAMNALVFGGAARDQDRNLERMALVARILGEKDSNAVSREQLAQQADQFTRSLRDERSRFDEEMKARREDSQEERKLTSRQIGTLEGQLAELVKGNDFTRKASAAGALLDQSKSAVEASFSVIDDASTLAGEDVKDRIDGVRKSMEQSIHSDFAPFSREISLLAASTPDDDEAKKSAMIGQVDQQVSGFERMFKDRLADVNSKPEIRAAAVIAANNYVQDMLGELGKLHSVASSADKKKLEAMQEKLVDVARTSVRATGVIEALDQSLSIDDATKAVARARVERRKQLAEAATSYRNEVIGATGKEDAALPTDALDVSKYGGPIETPAIDMTPVSRALEALSKTATPANTTSSGFGVPDAKVSVGGHELSPRVAQLVLERAQADKAATEASMARRETSNEQFAQAQERAQIGDLFGIGTWDPLNSSTSFQIQSILSGLAGGAVDTVRQMGKDIGGLFGSAPVITPKPTAASPGDGQEVKIISPNGRVSVVPKSFATPERVARWKEQGFMVVGLEGG